MSDKVIPIEPSFPVFEIELDGIMRQLVMKLDFVGRLHLSILGIKGTDFRAFRQPGPGEQVDPTAMALAFRLFTCTVAGNYVDVNRPGMPVEIPSPYYWAAVIPEERFGELCQKTIQAMLKVAPSAAGQLPAEASTAAKLN